MITCKPFSTISYNTNDFLIMQLNELIRTKKISFWCFIEHLAESDELKPHKHLFIIPNGKIDTSSLDTYFEEFDIDNDKPLKCIFFQSSRFVDFYLYTLHDADYLRSKCQDRKYHYTREEYICSNYDYFLELIHQSDFKSKTFNNFVSMVDTGGTFRSLVRNGFVPVQFIDKYEKAYNLLRSSSFDLMVEVDNTDLPFVDRD